MTALFHTSAELLYRSARRRSNQLTGGIVPGDASQLSETEWDCLLAMAASHGMRPLLYRFLSKSEGFIAVPGYIKSKLQDFTKQNLRRNLLMTGELISLLNMFVDDGINVIPFKGPTLTALAYGDLGLREFGDLDLLIDKHDFMKAQDLLIARGYYPEILLNAKEAPDFTEACNVMAFWHPEKEISVEMHWELSPKYLPFSPDPERLRRRMAPSHPGGQMVMTLSPEDLLVYLCAHGAKHVWEKFIWIVDIAGLIHRHSNQDWDRVYELAVEQRCERVLFLGLRLARDLIGAPLPAEIDRLIESDSESKRLAVEVNRRLFNSQLKPSEESHFICRLQSRLPDKIRTLIRIAITPSVADWISFPILRQFAWAFPLLRPLRLISKLVFSRDQ
jgi:Uncharacterised nucleotidyltransferase